VKCFFTSGLIGSVAFGKTVPVQHELSAVHAKDPARRSGMVFSSLK
jgi:hypothetical protein